MDTAMPVMPQPAQDQAGLEIPTISMSGYRMGRNLTLIAFWGLATVRFFTEVFPVLPRATQFIDLPLLMALSVHAVLGAVRSGAKVLRPSFTAPVLAFVGLWTISAYVNVGRVEPAPAALFLFGFMEPLFFYFLVYRIWPVGQALAVSRNLVALALLQFVVVVLVDIPRFGSSGNPDVFSGTFGDNAYQLVFFLLVAGTLVAGIATFERRRPIARIAVPFLFTTFLVIFAAQYRSLIVTTAITAIAVGVLIGAVRGRGIIIGMFVVLALILSFSVIASHIPISKLDPTVQALRTDPGLFLSSGKVQAAGDILSLYGDNPRYVFTGTGPGTYSSRAFRTFALLGYGASTDVAGPYVAALTGGTRYTTDVAQRYVLPRWYNSNPILGSNALSQPWSSYLALLAEVGLVGFLILIGMYVVAMIRAARMSLVAMFQAEPGDPLPAVLLATCIAMAVLLQMAFLENWLEVAKVTVPAWMLFAIATKEFRARQLARSG